jgi:hypothetical protein
MEAEKKDLEKAKKATRELLEWFDRGRYQPPEIFLNIAAGLMTTIAYHMDLRREHNDDESVPVRQEDLEPHWGLLLVVGGVCIVVGAVASVLLSKLF